MAVELGMKVRDLLTGLTGVAVARSEWLYGCARIGVESTELKKDGKASDSIWLDEQRVEQVGNERANIPVAETKPLPFTLGAKVKDSFTGFEGIATSKTVWISGTTTIGIEPTKMHEGKPVEPHSFDAARVQLIEQQAPPVSKQNSATSGGPQNDPSFR